MAINLPNFSEFDLRLRETTPTRFEKYIKRLNNMFAAMNVTAAAQKKAMLLHYVGEETCDVFDTLAVPEPTEDRDAYQTAVKSLSDYFEPQKCVDHHVYVFRKEVQKPDENVSEFSTRLQLLARKCEFDDVNLEIKRQIIQGTTSVRLRRKAIEQSLDLTDLLKTARAMETADEQTSEIERQQSNVVSYKSTKSHDDRQNMKFRANNRSGQCGLCGGKFPHRGDCPAKGKRCHNCDKLNHFSKVCRSKQKNRSRDKSKHYTRAVNDQSSSDNLHLTHDSEVNGNSDHTEYTFGGDVRESV
ncbi:uncharacterized protein LOC144350094 [Saccoglossus kowalevskii]